ncbi:MAG: hypothetical protein J6B26_08910 [Agathobacter sp.]|nr:hypothetical protein [Agathobacter sp.]
MKKKSLIIMAAALMMLSVPTDVHAETYSGGSGWKVDFDGEDLTSTFKSADINDAMYKLQPGDTVNIELDLKNTSEYETEWYMTNEVLQSLEDSQNVANGGAYTYILRYYNPEGGRETIYSSESVGGEGTTGAGEGLHQATDTLEDYFYVDYLAPGEAGKITLTVSLDGETQGNDYQDTMAKLQMNFAVEPIIVDEDDPTKVIAKRPVIIKTGDDLSGMIPSVVLFTAGIAVFVIAIVKVRADKKRAHENRAE